MPGGVGTALLTWAQQPPLGARADQNTRIFEDLSASNSPITSEQSSASLCYTSLFIASLGFLEDRRYFARVFKEEDP